MAIENQLSIYERQAFRLIAGLVVAVMFLIGISIILMSLIYWSLSATALKLLPSWQNQFKWLSDNFHFVMNPWGIITPLVVITVSGFLIGSRIGRDIWLCKRKYIMLIAFLLSAELILAGPFLLLSDDFTLWLLISIFYVFILLVPAYLKFFHVPMTKIWLKAQESARLKSENSNVSE
ncbi:hypothetical protein [uncultured Rubinisphaera sp.]|uniref:hypothetical protein n=1 Tax=uncultured Rubinisphaera sp. TaxID=1678686 RepID=UPI000EC7606B|nr:hypothetical protein [Planctomycetaceae bacterium]|tara:strand:- start:176 stop:709 length:534 start_codon:yes stop_codon:yes gene_type:complete